jgi:hypothetical protein
MAKANRKEHLPRREILSRSGSVTSWGGDVFVVGDVRRGVRLRHSHVSLDIRGEFITSVQGISAFSLRLAPEDAPGLGMAEIPCVGVWSSVKPSFEGGVALSHREFDLILGLAAAGKLASVHFHFQAPRYGKSLIASVSFSSDAPADE